MQLRYLFGPVTSEFATEHLRDAISAGHCLAFNDQGNLPLTIGHGDDWDDVVKRLPADWRPDAIALVMHYTSIPDGLWAAPIPIIGLAGDWNLLFHYYRRRLLDCDIVATDARGVEVLRRAGISQVRPFVMYGCGRPHLEDPSSLEDRDIDIGFVGNLHSNVQGKRMPWLERVAQFGDRWQVEIRTNLHGDAYRTFLRRVRIGFNRSIRGECNQRAFEVAAAGALLFQERSNLEVPKFFVDRQECVYYDEEDLEELLEYYLTHEEERSRIAEAGQRRVQTFGFEDLWNQFIAEVATELPAIAARRSERRGSDSKFDLVTRTWQSLISQYGDDPSLVPDLHRAIANDAPTATHHLCLGLLTWLGNADSTSAEQPIPLRARPHFETAVAIDSENPVSLLNLVEVLAQLGEVDKALSLAQRCLNLLARDRPGDPNWLSLPHFPPPFDHFRVKWETVAWEHAGDVAAETKAKQRLIWARIHEVIAALTDDSTHLYEAVIADPESAAARVAIGCALGSKGRLEEAAIHLQEGLKLSPFNPTAARSLFQAFKGIGAMSHAEALANTRRLLAKCVPDVISSEHWFSLINANTPASQARLSLCMIVKNEEDNLRDCLLSVKDIADEIIIVDTGSTDLTKQVAASLGGRVFDFPWIDNFAAARNESLRHAQGKWILWLDADDRIDEENRAKLMRLVNTLGDDNRAYVMKCRCLTNEDVANPTVVDHIRLFPNHPNLCWQHRVHEQILPSLHRQGVSVTWTDIVITHTGYVDRATVRRKQERDLRLLLLEREELNDHPFTLFNLGSTYLELGLPKSALPVLQKSLERSTPNDSISRKLFVLVAQALRRMGKLSEAVEACLSGRRFFPHNVEILFQEACVRDEMGDIAGARYCLEVALQSPEEVHFASVSEGMRGPQIRQMLAMLFLKERRVDDAVRVLRDGIAEAPDWVPLWIDLGQLLFGEQRFDELRELCATMERATKPNVAPRVLRARIMMANGEFRDAVALLCSVIADHPKALWPRIILSHALLQEGRDFAAAESALKAILEIDPNHQEARSNLQVLQLMTTEQARRAK